MQVEYDDLDVLLEIQKIDVAVIQAKKARVELPQRIEVVKVRKRRDEIAPKLDQVIELANAKQAEITKVEDEDRALAERQQRSQDDIERAGSDYRKVESHTKEMAGVAKRRVLLEETLRDLNAELDKINDVRNQVEDAIAACDARETQLRASYQQQDDELIGKMRELLAERAKLVDNVPAELVKLYEDTSAKTGGVAIGKLEDDHCGVCRSQIEGGRLIEVRSEAPLGTCPNCRRLLIIE